MKEKVKDPKELRPEELKAIREFAAPVCRYPRDAKQDYQNCVLKTSGDETLEAKIVHSLSDLVDSIRHLLFQSLQGAELSGVELGEQASISYDWLDIVYRNSRVRPSERQLSK